MAIDETYIAKKGFEDLFDALMNDYRREAKAILDEVDNKGRRNDDRRVDEEFADWLTRLGAEAAVKLDALVERYKPQFRSLADEIIKIPKKL